jgi:hypothetical protein
MNDLGRIDYEDTFSVPCPPRTTATDVLLGFFSAAPKIVVLMMALRNRVVAIFGLKNTARIAPLDASMLQSGKHIGFFELGAVTPASAVIGADDSHLNFRVLFHIQNDVLSCKTQVHFNNASGRIYFLFVKPFHRLIVPTMLRASVKNPGQQ